jgi:serine/threonine protein phosphatase 1
VVRRGSLGRVRAELAATAIPTWSDPRLPATDAAALALQTAPGRVRAGRRVYAIGDIHGCLSQLTALHALIAEDLARRPIASASLIHLGDYIDQGPDSAGVVALLAAGSPVVGTDTINLLGEHEQTMLEALSGDRAAATDWLHAGGRAALASWGADPEARATWPAALPTAHLAFLHSLKLSHREGDYLFVHAGIRPGVRLAQQTRDDLLRMRQPFLYSEQDFGLVVVHGHTPGPLPVIKSNRICLDTGAGTGGKLTCAVLEDDRIGLLCA